MLAFNCDIGEVISSAASTNYDDDGYILVKAASILRRQSISLKAYNSIQLYQALNFLCIYYKFECFLTIATFCWMGNGKSFER